MGYIYKIVNDINDKIYIGQTSRTIKERWKEHKLDAQTRLKEKRLLYSAIRKYGIEHFSIIIIEETENLDEREKYWISYYNSYHNGYNATFGGEGSRIYDYSSIVKLYNKEQNMEEVARQLNISKDTVREALRVNNINIIHSSQIAKEKYQKAVSQYDMNNNYIKTYLSLQDAARAVLPGDSYDIKGAASHIGDVCKGRRKTAYKYKWKFNE